MRLFENERDNAKPCLVSTEKIKLENWHALARMSTYRTIQIRLLASLYTFKSLSLLRSEVSL